MGYALISYDTAPDQTKVGVAVIQVDGCLKTTSIDIPYGAIAYDAYWNSVVDVEVARVVKNMDPASDSYDASLVTP